MKIRVTRKSIAVIEIDPDNYPVGLSEDEMIELDRKNITEDPSIMDDWLTDDEVVIERTE